MLPQLLKRIRLREILPLCSSPCAESCAESPRGWRENQPLARKLYWIVQGDSAHESPGVATDWGQHRTGSAKMGNRVGVIRKLLLYPPELRGRTFSVAYLGGWPQAYGVTFFDHPCKTPSAQSGKSGSGSGVHLGLMRFSDELSAGMCGRHGRGALALNLHNSPTDVEDEREDKRYDAR